MTYVARVLPPAEYSRLIELGIPVDRLPDPEGTIVVVIELGGKIVGRWMALNAVMLEGLQIEEGYRHIPGVARKLLETMLKELRGRDLASVLTIVQSAAVGDLAAHAGFALLPGTLYQKDLRGDT